VPQLKNMIQAPEDRKANRVERAEDARLDRWSMVRTENNVAGGLPAAVKNLFGAEGDWYDKRSLSES
jgi:hypothetical protein